MREEISVKVSIALYLTLCVGLLVYGAYLTFQSLKWVPAPRHNVWHNTEGDGKRPWTVSWMPSEAAPNVTHSAPFPDRDNVQREIGNRRVWFDPEAPGVLCAFWEDRPISTVGIFLVFVSVPTILGVLLAMMRTRHVHYRS